MVRMSNFFAAILVVGIAFAGGAAQAQTALGSGVTVNVNQPLMSDPNINSLSLGTSSTSGLVTNWPMAYEIDSGQFVQLEFSGTSGLYSGTTSGVATAYTQWKDKNYLVGRSGSVALTFSQTQNYVSLDWGSVDSTNSLQFFNGDALIKTVRSADLGLNGWTSVVQAEFRFSELGFNRIVATDTSSSMEFANLRFAGPAPEVAPIPLNAASMGGLMSFLMMLGMWGKGGTHRMLRMMFASVAPRRRMAGVA